MSTSREADNETMAGVNSRFAEVTKDGILRMQENAVPNNVKKASKLGVRAKQYFNTQLLLSSQPFLILIAKLRWYLSLEQQLLPRFHFKGPIQVS